MVKAKFFEFSPCKRINHNAHAYFSAADWYSAAAAHLAKPFRLASIVSAFYFSGEFAKILGILRLFSKSYVNGIMQP
jgi:hypothetical protein